MEYLSIKEAVRQVLSQEASLSEVLVKSNPEELNELLNTLEIADAKLQKGTIGFADASGAVEKGGEGAGHEVVKFDENGQWSMNTIYQDAHPKTEEPKTEEGKPDSRTGVNIDKMDGMAGTMPDGGATMKEEGQD